MALRTTRLKMPPWFNPEEPAHEKWAVKQAEENTGISGWTAGVFNRDTGHMDFSVRDTIASATKVGNAVRISLGGQFSQLSDGPKANKAMEVTEWGKKGYVMTQFDPFSDSAVLQKLSPELLRCREAVASGIGSPPWEVQVEDRRGGGFVVSLPTRYVPSRHDDKIEEVAKVVVGADGWYVTFNRRARTAEIIPSTPPTFPAGIPYPVGQIEDYSTQESLLFGQALGPNGDTEGDLLSVVFSDGPHTMIQGTSGSGKSVTINALIAGALVAGMELVVVDVPAKAVDFTWCRDFVRPGGWGCASFDEGLAALDRTYREGKRRSAKLAEYDVQKIADLPPHEQANMPRIFIVVDELAGILRKVNIPKSLDKEDPRRVQAEEASVVRDLTLETLLKIGAEMRFVGLHLLTATQVATVNTGVPTELRDNSSNRIIMGSILNERVLRTALNSPEMAPEIPEHVRSDGAAARGVGIAELPGQQTQVFKGLFATTDQYRQAISGVGRRSIPLSLARPTSDDVTQAITGESPGANQDFSGGPLANDPDAGALDSMGNPLRGAAAAAHASKKYASG